MKITNMNQIILHGDLKITVTFRKERLGWRYSIAEYNTKTGTNRVTPYFTYGDVNTAIAGAEAILADTYNRPAPDPVIPPIPADLAHRLATPIRPTGDYRLMTFDHPIG